MEVSLDGAVMLDSDKADWVPLVCNNWFSIAGVGDICRIGRKRALCWQHLSTKPVFERMLPSSDNGNGSGSRLWRHSSVSMPHFSFMTS